MNKDQILLEKEAEVSRKVLFLFLSLLFSVYLKILFVVHIVFILVFFLKRNILYITNLFYIYICT